MPKDFTEKQKRVMNKISDDIHDILEGLSHKDKKVLLRVVKKMNHTNCWWFSYSLKKALGGYLENYFEGYELDKKERQIAEESE